MRPLDIYRVSDSFGVSTRYRTLGTIGALRDTPHHTPPDRPDPTNHTIRGWHSLGALAGFSSPSPFPNGSCTPRLRFPKSPIRLKIPSGQPGIHSVLEFFAGRALRLNESIFSSPRYLFLCGIFGSIWGLWEGGIDGA